MPGAKQVMKRFYQSGMKAIFWPDMKIWVLKFGDKFFFVPGSKRRLFAECGWVPVPDHLLEQTQKVFNATEHGGAAVTGVDK